MHPNKLQNSQHCTECTARPYLRTQGRSSRTQSYRRLASRHQRTSHMFHRRRQRHHCIERMPSAPDWCQCLQGISHRCHLCLRSPWHMARTSVVLQKARTPRHTGCTRQRHQPIQVHTAGKLFCRRLARCHHCMLRMCRLTRQSHRRSLHILPGCRRAGLSKRFPTRISMAACCLAAMRIAYYKRFA